MPVVTGASRELSCPCAVFSVPFSLDSTGPHFAAGHWWGLVVVGGGSVGGRQLAAGSCRGATIDNDLRVYCTQVPL